MRLSRGDLLRRATALAAGLAVTRVRWLETALAATDPVGRTLKALVSFVVPGQRIGAATVPRLTRTLDRFLPGPVPLSATVASILDGTAAHVKSGATFAQLSTAQKAKVFETLEQLPVETAGSIRFLVGNLPDLTAFLAYSSRQGWTQARYGGVSHGHAEFKGYWQGRRAAAPGA